MGEDGLVLGGVRGVRLDIRYCPNAFLVLYRIGCSSMRIEKISIFLFWIRLTLKIHLVRLISPPPCNARGRPPPQS